MSLRGTVHLDPVFLEQYLEKLQRKVEAFKLSRRRFLLGSIAATSVSNGFLSSPDRVRFVSRAGLVSILLDGTPRWVIAPERFSSESTLELLCHTQNEVRIRLTNVRLPGTMLAAEMQCDFRRVMGSWTFDFVLGEMGSVSRVDLIGWLSGNPVNFATTAASFFPTNSPIRLRSTAGKVSLDTSWTFMFPGGEAEIAGVRGVLPVSRIALRIAPSGYRSALLGGSSAASLITLERKQEAWGTNTFDLLQRNGCSLHGDAELFHSVEVESRGSEASTEFSAVFVSNGEPVHALKIPGTFQDRAGEPFELALAKPIYAITCDGAGRVHSAFISSLRERHIALAPSYAMVFDKPVNLHSDTDDPEAQDKLDLGLSRLVFAQHYEDEDTIFEFFVPTSGLDLDLWWFGAHPFPPVAWLRALWDAIIFRHEIIALDGFVLRVTRPRDFLSLHFTFANMASHVRQGKPWLIAKPGATGKPVLTAHFYPQHMLEESFEENSTGGADDTSPVMPVDVTLSGPTRLSFNLELGPEGDPLTVSKLLEWKTGALRKQCDMSQLAPLDQSPLRQTSFELPYRMKLDTTEQSTSFSLLECPSEPDSKDAPELWHVSLEPRVVEVTNAKRTAKPDSNVKITFKAPQSDWRKGDTFGVLEPPEFAGTFVLDDADGNSVTYTQNVAGATQSQPLLGQSSAALLTRTNFDMALANRFVAYQVIDETPMIKAGGVHRNGNSVTIQFEDAPPKVGEVINISAPRDTNICNDAPGPGTIVVSTVDAAQNAIIFQAPANIVVKDTSSVSVLSSSGVTSVVVDPDKRTVHVKTAVPHGLRLGDTPFLLGTTVKELNGKTYTVKASDNAKTFQIQSTSPLAPGEIATQGRMVATRLYPVTSNDRTQVGQLSLAQPLVMEQLILSALGAWASMEGNFQPNSSKSQNVTRFIYRFAQRRDYYVEVDYQGFLWPFGHRAVLLKITQRFIYNSKNPVTFPSPDENAAYLRTRFFVVVKQKSRTYMPAGLEGLQLPFVRIDFLTLSTPPLFAGGANAGNNVDSACASYFWPSTSTGMGGPAAPLPQPVLFKLRGYDSANPSNTVDFVAPLIFMSGPIGTNPDATAVKVQTEYSTRTFADGITLRRRVNFGGAPLHFAASATPGDTELHVTSIDFSAMLLKLNDTDPGYEPKAPATYTVAGDVDPAVPATATRPALPASLPVAFRPVLSSAQVDIPSVGVFSGQQAQASPVQVTYNAQYLKTGFHQVQIPASCATATRPSIPAGIQHPNPTEIFVDVKAQKASFYFPGTTGGGLANPSAGVNAVSRHSGPVSDAANAVCQPVWDPMMPAQAAPSLPSLDPLKAFNLGDAKLLGCIPIMDAISVIADLGANLHLAPALNLQKIYSAIEEATTDINKVKAAVLNFEAQLHAIDVAVQQAIQSYADALTTELKSWKTAIIGVPGEINGNISNFWKLYQKQAVALKKTLKEMQVVSASQPHPVVVSQEVWDNVRASADIDLTSAVTDRVFTFLNEETGNLAAQTSIAICTLKDLESKVLSVIASALRPLDPSRLPTQAVATSLEQLVACFDLANGPPKPADIRNKALVVQKALKNFVRIAELAPQQVKFDKHLLDGYFKQAEAQLAADAIKLLRETKKAMQDAVQQHGSAFQLFYTWFNKTYCNNQLPTNPADVGPYATAVAYQNAVTATHAYLNNAATLAESDLNDRINKQLNGMVDAVGSAVDPEIDALNSALDQFKQMLEIVDEVVNALQTPVSVTVTYTLAKIPMKDAPTGDPIFLAHRKGAQGTKKAVLEIDATVSAGLTPVQPQNASANASTQVTLSDFSLQLLPGAPFITVQFESFEFTAGTGQGTHSQCRLSDVAPVILGDALEFVAGLVCAFAPMGGGSGPKISLFGTGLGVGYSFALPQIAAGGFQIRGLAFEALLMLSFTGDPLKLRFYLASPQKHFLMSATIFGGGGFFGLELSSQGVDLVQGCMEFGATAALSLGVANGEVHILGGFYFEFGDRRCLLTGFVRAGGSLNILDIVEMTVEFYIGVTYKKIGSQTSVYGTCTVTVSISILFFSADVSMTMEWHWAGSKSNNDSASLPSSPPLYAMLEPGPNISGVADDSAVYAGSAAADSDQTKPNVNPRLAGWTPDKWNTYTAAFMEN
jgi:hypothetical protein